MSSTRNKVWGVVLILLGLAFIGAAVFLLLMQQQVAALEHDAEFQLRLAFSSAQERANWNEGIQSMRLLTQFGLPAGVVLGILSLVFAVVLLVRQSPPSRASATFLDGHQPPPFSGGNRGADVVSGGNRGADVVSGGNRGAGIERPFASGGDAKPAHAASPRGAAAPTSYQRKYCPNCGAAQSADDRFCVTCGKALSEAGRP